MGKEILEKSSQTFMVVLLGEVPYLFVVSKIKNVHVNGKEYLAFPLSDPNVEIALSTDSRIYGLSFLQKEKKIFRFNGIGLVSKDEEILKKLEGKGVDFAVLLRIESFREEELE